MSTNGAAALLILSWLTLSCFGLVEDLNQLIAQAGVSTTTAQHGSARRGADWDALTNNIVESATRARHDSTFLSVMEFRRSGEAVFAFRRQSPLHKLHRVFLI